MTALEVCRTTTVALYLAGAVTAAVVARRCLRDSPDLLGRVRGPRWRRVAALGLCWPVPLLVVAWLSFPLPAPARAPGPRWGPGRGCAVMHPESDEEWQAHLEAQDHAEYLAYLDECDEEDQLDDEGGEDSDG